MYNILLIEDSEICRTIATRALNHPDMNVTSAVCAKEALQLLNSRNFDLILLDLILPDGDGLDILNTIQAQDKLREKPVFLLTSKEDLASKVSAFSLGADDYLTKPVNPIELRARVEMRLRKTRTQKRDVETMHCGGLTIDISMMKTFVKEKGGDQLADLTSKEFKILTFLAHHPGRVFSRNELVRAIWGENTHVVDRTVDSHVCGLRRKIKPYSHYIESIPSAGYRFMIHDEI